MFCAQKNAALVVAFVLACPRFGFGQVMAPTATRWPTLNRPLAAASSPNSWITPTDSCPSVRPWRQPIATATVWLPEVHMSTAVVRMMASLGPGRGTGLPVNGAGLSA